jgi:alkylhydroperoxidase family enzyme
MARTLVASTLLDTSGASGACRVGKALLMHPRTAPTGDAPRRRADVLGIRPELAAAHARLVETIWAGRVSPVTLELCRLRMAMLLGSAAALAERTDAATRAGLTEDRIARLPQWPTDPSFSDEERTCIGFVESFLIDHDQISDDDVRSLTDALTAEGVVTFTTALVVWDNQHRLDNALHVAAGQG